MKRLLLISLVLFLACEDKKEEPLPIDCAGIEGGNAVLDECGVCNGDNSTCQLNFSLEDLNPSSETFGMNIGPQFFNEKVTLYYFPYSETWGTCQNRFGSLNSLYFEYGGSNSNLRIIGVGKDDGNDVTPIIQNRVLPYVKDNSSQNVWESWSPNDRDLFFLDKDGYFHTKINLDSGFPENDIRQIIDQLLEQ